LSVFIRDFERSTWFDGHKTDFILDWTITQGMLVVHLREF